MGNKEGKQQIPGNRQEENLPQAAVQQDKSKNSKPDLETEFLDKVLDTRKEKWKGCLKEFKVFTMSDLMGAYNLDRQSKVGRRCNEAEHLILNDYFLKKQKEVVIDIDEIYLQEKQIKAPGEVESIDPLIQRNILIVGITGQGKTTFINTFITYLFGVNKIITKESERENKQVNKRYYVIKTNNSSANSDTQEVISYQIQKEGYLFNFIDTPGLGDTGGFNKDQEIIEKISNYLEKQLYNQDQKLHAVLVVSQSSTQYETTDGTRSLLQMAMLNILKLFGKNMCEFSKHVITFSDFTSANQQNFESERSIFYSLSLSQVDLFRTRKQLLTEDTINQQFDEPSNQQLTAEQAKQQQYYQFQNSVFKVKKIGFIEKIQFEKNITNYNKLFERLKSNEGFDLKYTKTVIDQRKRIKDELDSINKKLGDLISFRRKIETSINKMKIYEKKESDSSNFKYSTFKIVCESVEAKKDEFFTNCLSCNKTCHEKCKVSNNQLDHCTAMMTVYQDGIEQREKQCQSCKCSVSKHRNEKKKWFFKQIEEEHIYEDLKKENDEAKNQKNKFQSDITEQENQKKAIDIQIKEVLFEMKTCLEVLLSSALYKLDIKDVQVLDYIERCFPQYQDVMKEFKKENIGEDLKISKQLQESAQDKSYATKVFDKNSTQAFQEKQFKRADNQITDN